jgi:hypothetical protein
MFQYLPASFVFKSKVTDVEKLSLEEFYMPFVLKNSEKLSKDNIHLRTDYFDRTMEPWKLFTDILFGHFSRFVSEFLVESDEYSAHFYPWFNFYMAGGSMIPHTHPQNDFGCIYCLRNGGRKKTLFDIYSHEYASMQNRYSKLQKSRAEWAPEPGDFVFFPASLYHCTQPVDIDGERITLIANIVMTKERNQPELSLKLKFPPQEIVF